MLVVVLPFIGSHHLQLLTRVDLGEFRTLNGYIVLSNEILLSILGHEGNNEHQAEHESGCENDSGESCGSGEVVHVIVLP